MSSVSSHALATYVQLIGLFGMLSLLSIGGGNVVLPEMHMHAVNGRHWLTNSQFADLFSISQTAPGPSILIVSMVGYGAGLQAGGIPGAIIGGVISMVAMVVPAATFVYVVTLFWQRAQESNWRIAVEKGFAPLTVGLILAVLALIVSAVVWAYGANSSNPHLAGRGKIGVLVSCGAAIICGASVALVNFFWGIGQAV